MIEWFLNAALSGWLLFFVAMAFCFLPGNPVWTFVYITPLIPILVVVVFLHWVSVPDPNFLLSLYVGGSVALGGLAALFS